MLPDPPSQGLAGYHEVLGHLGDRLARGAVEHDGFPLEFRRIVWCWSRHPDLLSGGLIVPTLECPSYRGKPTCFVLGDTHYDAKNPKESCARGERAIFVYQLALLYRHEHQMSLDNVGLKAFLRAA